MLSYKYIILSIIQGITEPLPISSSGHLKIIETLLNKSFISDLNFEILVNFGSLLAIIFLFRKKIISIIYDSFMFLKTKKKEYRNNFNYALKIIIGTFPVGIFGLLVKDFLEKYSNIKLIGLALIITSFFLYLIKDKIGFKSKERITFLDSFIIGIYQVFALIPGISRSGATLTGCMNLNFDRETALDFSFMLYIPVSIASTIVSIKEIDVSSIIWPYSLYILISGIITYFSTIFFINITKNGKLIYFVLYCLTVGLIVFSLL